MKTATRIIAYFITVLLALTICFPISAAASRIDGYESGSLYDYFHLGQSQDPGNLIVYPGDEIRIPLTADLFTFSDGKVSAFMEAVNYGQLSRVRVRTQTREGSGVLDYVQFDTDTFPGRPFVQPGRTTFTGKTAYISVMFAKEFISVEDKRFSFSIYLSIDGKKYEELVIDLEGTLQVVTIEVNKRNTHINLSDGFVAEATESVDNVCADLGAGVSVYVNMFKGQRYCGQAKILEGIDAYMNDLDLAKLELDDIELPDLYPAIDMIYKLQSVGLRRSSSKVKIDVERKYYPSDRTYHVYDEDLRYLGVVEDALPYSSYYFVTSEKIPHFEALPVNQ